MANELVSEINKGIAVLVGISRDDTREDSLYMARKLVNLRLWDSDQKRWSVSVKSGGFDVLLVSQFTLYSVMKGNKLDFHNAMAADEAREYFDTFCDDVRKELRDSGSDNGSLEERVKTGAFGEMMHVNLTNDGPVTVTIDSRNRMG